MNDILYLLLYLHIIHLILKGMNADFDYLEINRGTTG